MNEIKGKPNYYAVLPAQVRYDENLTPNAKLLYAEITALTNANGMCWAGDQYFMKLYNVSRPTIQRWLKSLEDNGYVKREVIYENGTNKIEKRYIRVYSKMRQGYTQNRDKGILKNETENITSTNNINNNINKYDKVPFFNDFWKLYPRKVGKATALNSFKRKVKNEDTFKLIVNDLERRKNFEPWIKDNGKYIPHPSTYLNQERWLDEYETNFVTNDTKDKEIAEEEEVFGELL